MSAEKKRSITFHFSEKDLQSLYDLIGFSDKSGEFISGSMENYLKKLLFDNSLPQASDKIHSDVTTETDSLQERAKSNPDLKEALDSVKTESDKSLHPPPCNYASQSSKAGMVNCDNPRRTQKKAPVALELTACQKCFERKEWVKEHQKETPQQLKQVYCHEGGLWLKPLLCLTCRRPCEKAPDSNPNLSIAEKFKRARKDDNPQGESDAQN